MGTKQHTTERKLGQRRNQRGKCLIILIKCNEATAYQNLCHKLNRVKRGKFTTLCAYIKTSEIPQISNLMTYLESLEKQEQGPKRSRQGKIIKIRTEINEIETNKAITKN